MGTFRQVLRAPRLASVAVIVCSLTIAGAGTSLALAQGEQSDSEASADDGADDGARKARRSRNREGQYGGVVPDREPDPDDTRRTRRKRKNAVSWIGFQPQDGGRARVFVRMANELEYAQHLAGNVLYINIAGARYRHRNTLRRLDMRHFETALETVTSKRVSRRRARKGKHARKRGIELRISFKDAKDAREAAASLAAGKDGYTYLYLDFPPAAGSGSVTVSDPEEPASEE